MKRIEQLDTMLETHHVEELLDKLVQWLPDATFQQFFNDVHEEPVVELEEADDYDDSMDGDHESALASCGWGTDEDNGGNIEY